MPQATDETRDAMTALFGDAGHDEHSHDYRAWEYLKARGWTETRYVIALPKPDYHPTDAEWSCVDYLCDEWDWGFDAGGRQEA